MESHIGIESINDEFMILLNLQRRRLTRGSRSDKTDSGFLSGLSREASPSAKRC